jgi:hypothetical protein
VDSRQVFEHPCVKNKTAFFGEFGELGWTQVQQAEESCRIQALTGKYAKNDAISKTADLA